MFPLEFRAEVNREETRVMGLSLHHMTVVVFRAFIDNKLWTIEWDGLVCRSSKMDQQGNWEAAEITARKCFLLFIIILLPFHNYVY